MATNKQKHQDRTGGDPAGPSDEPALDFEEILEQELQEIRVLRRRRGVLAQERPPATAELAPSELVEAPKPRPVIARAHGQRLVGLALSGGGIRSATFNLGILQALAQLDLLRHFDYLSTVSGGGYIGGWLVAWIRRRGLDAACAGLSREHEVNPSKLPDGAADGSREEATAARAGGDLPEPDPATAEADPTRPAHADPQTVAAGEQADEDVESTEPPRQPPPPPLRTHPISFLRSYANYLTPQTGLFSLDTWMAAASYLRNLILNLHVLVLALAAVLLLPRLFLGLTFHLQAQTPAPWNSPAVLLAVIGALALVVAWATAVKLELAWTEEWKMRSRWLTGPGGILWTIILPLFLICVLLVYWLYGEERSASYGEWASRGAFVHAVFWAIVGCFWWVYWWRRSRRDKKPLFGSIDKQGIKKKRDVLIWLGAVGCAALAGAAASWLLAVLIATRAEHTLNATQWLKVAAWAPPGLVLTIQLAGVFFIGLMGKSQPEEERQWWSRMGGWLGIVAASWWLLFLVAFYVPPLMRWLAHEAPTLLSTVGAGWLGSTILGVIAGRSPATNDQESNRWLELGTKVTPYVFVVGLLMLLSWFIDWLLPRLVAALPHWLGGRGKVELFTWTVTEASWSAELAALRDEQLGWTADWLQEHFWAVLACTLLSLVAAYLLSWRLDINEFSMHNFYRDRLTRPYLGASRERQPHPFTGFDREDDLRLCHLLDDPPRGKPNEPDEPDEPVHPYDGPYPLINTALNLTSGAQELAWQERQANSFIFTPRHHGFEPGPAEKDAGVRQAYRPSGELGPRDRRKSQGISLGTAMTVSGAAVNPNMGYHSAPALAFLLTVFNARLGLWMGNPAAPQKKIWARKAPLFSLHALLQELFGQTGASSSWVNLADGGFFDNLGVYELVRRRCRFILACDAEGDPQLEFGGLGNVIRRCRTDFGVEIRFENLEPLRHLEGSPYSRWHCAVGKILYNRVDVHAPDGILVYVKATLTGDEPADLLNYHRRNPEFPHQSTGDQWFDESQFESYRHLGQHTGLVVFGAAGLRAELKASEEE